MPTYKPLQSVALTTTASSITFSGIDQSYTDLVLVSSIKVTTGTPVVRLLVNSDTNSNYSRTGMYGDTSAVGYKETSAANLQLISVVDDFTPMTLHFANYSNTTTNKAILMRTGITYPGIQAGLYRNTSAIDTLTLNLSASTFEPGSTFDLYGIESGAPQALGGDLVTTDGNYWYHTFRSTQQFIPLRPLTVDYLVVAGGGAGVGNSGGGGGAGGMRCTVTGTGGSGSLESALSLSATSYTVTVGAGGAGASSSNNLRGNNGSNSTFATITSTGGGGGGNRLGGSPIGNGATGGSGGGGASDGYTGGAASPSGQGFAGGSSPGSQNPSGGGGGAGAVGQDGGSANPSGGDGGAGRATSISGSSVTYAGGGGGSTAGAGTGEGGAGGGGAGGANNTAGTAGTANTGGGGGAGTGGAGTGTNGGSGGSGIVIVRYAV